MSTERDTSRFAALLQPIRDLTQNWSIDIAQELEEYLDDIAEITISFDGGSSNLNFAEAALLIQGSACVYSKKVEFLHALVYQTLDFINDKRQAHERMSMGGATGASGKSAVNNVLHYTEYDFLDLNDHLVESEGIDLADDGFDVDASLVALPPASLAHNNHNRGGDSMEFRTAMCSVHPSGALVLDQEDHLTFNKNLEVVDSHDNDMMVGEVGGFNSDSDDGGDLELESSFQAHLAHSGGGFDDHVVMTPGGPRGRPIPAPVPEPPADPWAMLDPHSAGTAKMKPFKKGKTFTTPRLPVVKLGASAFLHAFDSTSTTNSPSQFKNVYFSEFRYLQKSETRRRNAVKKEERKAKQAQRNSQSPVAMMFEYDDDGGSEDDEAFGASPGVAFDGFDADGGAGMDGPSWFDNQHNGQHGAADQGASFEDLCRKHMDTFLSGFEKYAKETHLSKRVSDWQDKLEPVLEEQDHHPAFDIQEYGTRVLDVFPEDADTTQEELDLGEIAEQATTEPYEICRMFLAMLQLANNGNVHIAETNETDDMRVQLLTRKPAYEFNAADAQVHANEMSVPAMPLQAQVMQDA